MNVVPRGIWLRIALAAVAAAVVAIAVVAAGVVVVGGSTFSDLMAQHGVSTASSNEMFDQAVVRVVLVATALAAAVAVAVAAILARRLAKPLDEMGAAARRIAEGSYETRIRREGPEEIVSLADSFNQMAAALEEQERLRREFIANAAHELRTPLTNLQGYLEALRDGVLPPERETFVSLWEEADRLVRLSQSLDTLAEGDTGTGTPNPTEIDLSAAVRAAVDLARPAVRAAGLELTVELPARLHARADPDHLAQVLANLLQNAVRYTPRGGRIVVRAEPQPGTVLVSVANTGDGIPAGDLPHVFERFYRVEKSRDRAHGGAGIGLSIVRQLVEAAGGRVGADSEAGLTRFWFSLPS